MASSGLIWFGGLDLQKYEKAILQLISLCENLIWSHFGASAGQGPFWRSPGKVWGEVWERYEQVKSRQYLKVPCTLCDDFGGFVVVLLWRCCCVVVGASPPVCEDLVTFLCLF